ncbi:phosphoesterase (plasmid) [Vescimonas fastidiosa]|uniref:Cyclic-di-AMP phosphodiesterase n=1 Tax=Vescimonas fastidiosa TaxID=2714353 RepID=A0A810Q4M5_9FIRM|nr:DHH family phosphoesterase [Vescimonas fastidiosa]BCK79673.1 phosphoesterase [Vescimonas fastidiosa]
MNGKLRKLVQTNMVLYILLLLVFAGLTARLSPLLAAGEVAAALLVWYVSRRRNKVMQQQLHQYVERISGGADTAKTSNMLFAPMPMMVFNPDSEDVLWANDLFAELPGVGENIYESRVRDVVKGFETHWLMEGKPEYPGIFTWNDRRYRVFGCLSQPEEKGRFGVLATTYWMDVTDLEHMRSTLEETKPVAAIVMIDNYEDLMSACPEGKRSAIRAAIEEKMDQWRGTSGALLMKYDRDRYLMVFTEKQYEAFAQGRFAILDEVRTVQAAEGVYATMSIGVGREAGSYDALFKNAGLALEMALSRGGDQAVVKDRMNFEFYGGRAKTTEKRTKVKSRVMANALGDLMDETEHVYVMGHQYADMDTLGAAAGVCAIARKRGKVARIVMDTENNSVGPMLRKLKALPEYKDVFIGGGDAFLRVQPDTLLVVVDTNRPASVESEPLLEACNRVAVIDHHRRGSSYIEKMALNFHEPYASSASELVTELLGYLLEPGDLLKTEAEALLAGIVLDTKNFTNRTGGRTFEAAAYLRRAGADTQDVQRMFQSDLESMIDRYAIIRQAVLYREDLAIAAIDEECERVTAAKAADELLTLSGVQASFVFYPKDGGVYISARSLGEVNVQVIVEALGGGGNSTSAGGQLPGVTVEQVRQMLQEAIDKYYEKSNQGGTAK